MARMAAGIRENQHLADDLFSPVVSLGSHREDRSESILNYLFRASALGYDFELLLAYFYQDWSGGDAFGAVRDAVLDAVEQFSPERPSDRGGALVLGSGTGGLVHALAEVWPRVDAVDLSLTANLLARRVLSDGLHFHLFSRKMGIANQNDCIDVHIPAPDPPAGSVRWFCADAARLPQPTEGSRLVVTQYLLDLVPDLERLVGEIHRVLENDGLWINFGLPFGRAGEEDTVGTRGPHELRPFFRAHGFDLCEIDRGPFRLLDRTAVLPEATLIIDHPLFFAARKTRSSPLPVDIAAFFDYFSGQSPAVLDRIPVLKREIGFSEQEVFGPTSRTTTRKLWIGSRGQVLSVPEAVERSVRTLAESLEEGLSIRETAFRLAAGPSGGPSESDLVETFRFLVERKIVELS